ncbi:hypothetical protein Tco_0152356 [Tanacetum coccineum]
MFKRGHIQRAMDEFKEDKLFDGHTRSDAAVPHTKKFKQGSLGPLSGDISERPPSQDPHEVTVAQWRSRVAARSSPPSPPIRQILPAPSTLPCRPAVLILPGQPILVGRPYCTQPNGVLQMLTARKRVGPLPTHRLALRYSADYSSSDHFTADDSSRDSLSDSSSETSSDSHSNTSSDSPTATFAGPSPKRCRSPTTSVPVASPVPRALSPVHADLLPPRKRIRDFDSVTDVEDREIGLGVDVKDNYEPYTEPDIDSDVQADIDACITFTDDIPVRGTNVRVEVDTAAEEEAEPSARGTIEIGVEQVTHPVVSDDTTESVREDLPELVSVDGSLEFTQRGLDVVMQELYDHVVGIPVYRVRVIDSV